MPKAIPTVVDDLAIAAKSRIPKPDGGVRKLGIPTVLDRTFSEHSYGFRPGRSAHQAVAQAQQYIASGYNWVVDLDSHRRALESSAGHEPEK
jgi:retron-type reverse transcriptase